MEFKVGDTVKIRSWKSMVNEFGVDEYGDVPVEESGIWFALSMKSYCGKVMTISDTYCGGDRFHLNYDDWWGFTKSMFDPRECKEGGNVEAKSW